MCSAITALIQWTSPCVGFCDCTPPTGIVPINAARSRNRKACTDGREEDEKKWQASKIYSISLKYGKFCCCWFRCYSCITTKRNALKIVCTLTIHGWWYWCRHCWRCWIVVAASDLRWATVMRLWTCYMAISTVYWTAIVVIVCLGVVIIESVQISLRCTTPGEWWGCWLLLILCVCNGKK